MTDKQHPNQQPLPQTIQVQHPLLDVPTIADVINLWLKEGTAIGYLLQFPDGHRCCLTWGEINKEPSV